nr:polyadenylate-specific 3'-exoribonuclease AS [Glycomyces sp. L485]
MVLPPSVGPGPRVPSDDRCLFRSCTEPGVGNFTLRWVLRSQGALVARSNVRAIIRILALNVRYHFLHVRIARSDTGHQIVWRSVDSSPATYGRLPGTAEDAARDHRKGRCVAYRYFYDCEFIEDGRTIDLVSIGVVDEHGREYYAVSTEFDPSRAIDWVRRNVLDKLPGPASPLWKGRATIRDELYEFLIAPVRKKSGSHPGERIEMWAWYGAYDHVVFAQLWGAMPELPRALPRMTKDLRQRWDDLGRPELPVADDADLHDALTDAKLNLERWAALEAFRRERSIPDLR